MTWNDDEKRQNEALSHLRPNTIGIHEPKKVVETGKILKN